MERIYLLTILLFCRCQIGFFSADVLPNLLNATRGEDGNQLGREDKLPNMANETQGLDDIQPKGGNMSTRAEDNLPNEANETQGLDDIQPKRGNMSTRAEDNLPNRANETQRLDDIQPKGGNMSLRAEDKLPNMANETQGLDDIKPKGGNMSTRAGRAWPVRTRSSSVWPAVYGNHWHSHFAIDGLTSYQSTGYFHSAEENFPWLQIELSHLDLVASVTIVNRKDCCYERFKNVEIRAGTSEVPYGIVYQFLTHNTVCATFSGPAKNTQDIILGCPTPIISKYVTIQLKEWGILQVNEFKFESVCSGYNNQWACCTPSSPCGVGQGDCDSDADCSGSLVCGLKGDSSENCRSFDPSAHSQADCCIQPLPIHGGWSSWGSCSKSCRYGYSYGYQYRSCTNPRPQHGGNNCYGYHYRKCNENVCCPDNSGARIVEKETAYPSSPTKSCPTYPEPTPCPIIPCPPIPTCSTTSTPSKATVTKPPATSSCKPNKKCAKKNGKCFGEGDTVPKNAKRKGWCNTKMKCKCYEV